MFFTIHIPLATKFNMLNQNAARKLLVLHLSFYNTVRELIKKGVAVTIVMKMMYNSVTLW